MEPAVEYSYLPYATSYGYNLPAPHVVASPAVQPVVQAAPVPVAQAVQPVVQAAPVPVDQAVQPVIQAASVPIVTAQTADLTNSQFHAQDDLGQYNYGYSSPTSTKQELKTADGVTRGSYSYVDANGLVQTVNYISDALGFKVAATNLPVHHVEGAHAEPVPEVQVAEEPVVAAYKGVMEPAVDYSYLPYATSYGYNLPAPHVVAAPAVQQVVQPVVQAAPVPVVQAAPAPVVQAAPVPVVQA